MAKVAAFIIADIVQLERERVVAATIGPEVRAKVRARVSAVVGRQARTRSS